jgi:hypothetical protein
MAVTQTLRMTFLNESGNNVSISLDNPKDDLTAAQVQTAMDLIITKNIFISTGGDLVSKASARIIDTDVNVLFGS